MESSDRQWVKRREKLAPVGTLLGRWEIAIPKIKQSPRLNHQAGRKSTEVSRKLVCLAKTVLALCTSRSRGKTQDPTRNEERRGFHKLCELTP